MKRERKYYKLASKFKTRSVYYVDAFQFPGPTDLLKLRKKSSEEVGYMTPVRIVDLKTVEFLEPEVRGHDASGRVPSGQGWCIDVKYYIHLLYVDSEAGDEVSIKKGKFKGKKGKIIERFSTYSLVKFGEDVGGCSLDGSFPKGSCLFIKDSDLKFCKPKGKVEDKIGEKTEVGKDKEKEHIALLPLTEEICRGGEEVVLTTYIYGNSDSNPVWDYNCNRIVGIIIDPSCPRDHSLPIAVKWPNGIINNYKLGDLSVVVR